MQEVRDLLKDPNTISVRYSTYDNAKNLPKSFINKIISKYEGTRLGRQELYAEILDDLPGSLWQRAQIDASRWPPAKCSVDDAAKLCLRTVVAIDPSVSSGEDSDETGLSVVGITETHEGLVLADESFRGTPHEWSSRAIALYRRFHADCIVAEVNNGGDLVIDTIRNVDPNVPCRKVSATRGKYVRAEPISLLYEQGRVHHVGFFPKLEDQMCMFVQDEIDRKSPDRVDALVWGFTELFDRVTGYGVLEVNRIAKVAQSSLVKPAVAAQMPECPNCGSKDKLVRMGGLFKCGGCSLVFGGSVTQVPHTNRSIYSGHQSRMI
jgi:phage terminase large subunit-like protein/ribosomal protein L37AE/L43A